jgi:hypothetical protein
MWIDLTPEMERYARSIEKAMKGVVAPLGPNYTGLAVDERFFIGYLGDTFVAKMLELAGKRYSYIPHLIGQEGTDDIDVWVMGERVTIEIKATPSLNHRYLMMPSQQFARFVPDHPTIYVAVFIGTEGAEIAGYAHREDFEETFVRIPTMQVHRDNLHSIDYLLERLDNADI